MRDQNFCNISSLVFWAEPICELRFLKNIRLRFKVSVLFVCLFYLVLKHSYQGLVKNLDGNEIKKYININISYSKIIF